MKTTRRWRPQVRLRTLIGIMLLVSLASGWWVHYLQGFKRQQAAALALGKLGARIQYRLPEMPWIPAWLDHDLRYHVVKVNLSHCQFTAQDLARLREFPQLERLLLNNTQLNDEGLAHIAQCRRLQLLSFWRCEQVTDQGIAALGPLKSLTRLDMHSTHVTGAGCESWPVMPRLQKLILARTNLDDRGLAALAGKLPALRRISLAETRVTGEGFRDWPTNPQIRELDLWYTSLTNAGMSELDCFLGVMVLKISDTLAIERLPMFPQLAEVWIDESQYSPAWRPIDASKILKVTRRLNVAPVASVSSFPAPDNDAIFHLVAPVPANNEAIKSD